MKRHNESNALLLVVVILVGSWMFTAAWMLR